ncbi:MAG: formate--tetrahydrofolate ligase [Nitrosomonadaceae bacterium]
MSDIEIAREATLKLADYVVTEAGFGADLGAAKFACQPVLNSLLRSVVTL